MPRTLKETIAIYKEMIFNTKIKYESKWKCSYSTHHNKTHDSIRNAGSSTLITFSDMRGFNCGGIWHTFKYCERWSESTKCFNCGKYMATFQLHVPKKIWVADMIVDIWIEDYKLSGLVDAGIDRNLLQEHAYEKFGSPTLRPTFQIWRGFGMTNEGSPIQSQVWCEYKIKRQ